MKNQPAHKIKVGAITATIWVNQGQDGKGDFYKLGLERSFKVGEEWKRSTLFSRLDLPKVRDLLVKAEEWIALREPTVTAAD